MPHSLSPGHVSSPWLSGPVALSWGHLPLSAVLCVTVIFRWQTRSEVEALIEDPQSKRTVTMRECKQVLVHILTGERYSFRELQSQSHFLLNIWTEVCMPGELSSQNQLQRYSGWQLTSNEGRFWSLEAVDVDPFSELEKRERQIANETVIEKIKSSHYCFSVNNVCQTICGSIGLNSFRMIVYMNAK